MDVKAQLIARQFVDCLLDGEVLSLLIPKNRWDDLEDEDDEDEDESDAAHSVTRNLLQADTARSYAQTMAVIAFQAELVTTRKTVSLRDVYYSLKHLFSKQSECNSIVLDVGRLCELKRHDMGVIASAKGYVSGKIKFKFHSSECDLNTVPWTYCDDPTTDRRVMIGYQWMSSVLYQANKSMHVGHDDGLEYRDDIEMVSIQCTTQDIRPCFIVVVEKEGVFHRLVEDEITSRVPCILVTGSGYPDIATRALVKKLVDYFKDIEVVGLCDYNPQGLALLMTYRMTTLASCFEASGLQVPLKWLGLRHTHIQALQEGNESSSAVLCGKTIDGFTLSYSHVFQSLSTHDVNKLNAMISKQRVPSEYVGELESMLLGGVKCELEALYSLGLAFLCDFVIDGLTRGGYA